MAALSKKVRKRFKEEGFEDLQIFASGGFDEFKITDVLQRDAQIDAFGIGTKMGVAADGPFTDMAYKLVQYGGRPVLKLSSGKKTLVSEKQVYRTMQGRRMREDVIALREEALDGEPLLKKVMEKGKKKDGPETLETIRDRFRSDFDALGERFKALENPGTYPVEISSGLQALQKEVVHEVMEKELGES